MDARTLKALKGSISKWAGIVRGTESDKGGANCPLCTEFYRPDTASCRGCPVVARVRKYGCFRTPYEAWADTHDGDRPWRARSEKQRAAARKELAFLKSLLPKSKKVKR